MDPLSITASTVALVGLCVKLSNGLQKLVDLSSIPEDIASLVEELKDLQNVLTAVCVVTQQRASVKGIREASDELKALLTKAGVTFNTIANYCGIPIHSKQGQGFETSFENPPNLDLLSRFRWLKDRKKIELYRRRLEVVRLDIANHLSSLSL